MTSRDFAYWLQGFFEVSNQKTITEEQTTVIKNHLNLVFKHEIDKQYKEGDGTQEVHDGKKPEPNTNSYDWNKSNSGLLRC